MVFATYIDGEEPVIVPHSGPKGSYGRFISMEAAEETVAAFMRGGIVREPWVHLF
jgi:hypothetical protein